jgi:hypothetical protein
MSRTTTTTPPRPPTTTANTTNTDNHAGQDAINAMAQSLQRSAKFRKLNDARAAPTIESLSEQLAIHPNDCFNPDIATNVLSLCMSGYGIKKAKDTKYNVYPSTKRIVNHLRLFGIKDKKGVLKRNYSEAFRIRTCYLPENMDPARWNQLPVGLKKYIVLKQARDKEAAALSAINTRLRDLKPSIIAAVQTSPTFPLLNHCGNVLIRYVEPTFDDSYITRRNLKSLTEKVCFNDARIRRVRMDIGEQIMRSLKEKLVPARTDDVIKFSKDPLRRDAHRYLQCPAEVLQFELDPTHFHIDAIVERNGPGPGVRPAPGPGGATGTGTGTGTSSNDTSTDTDTDTSTGTSPTVTSRHETNQVYVNNVRAGDYVYQDQDQDHDMDIDMDMDGHGGGNGGDGGSNGIVGENDMIMFHAVANRDVATVTVPAAPVPSPSDSECDHVVQFAKVAARPDLRALVEMPSKDMMKDYMEYVNRVCDSTKHTRNIALCDAELKPLKASAMDALKQGVRLHQDCEDECHSFLLPDGRRIYLSETKTYEKLTLEKFFEYCYVDILNLLTEHSKSNVAHIQGHGTMAVFSAVPDDVATNDYVRVLLHDIFAAVVEDRRSRLQAKIVTKVL